ncbi:MAG: 50S ribosomal protein L32 [Candidatus Andersenbacteria bacterium]|nr:50S ribosomal protein L32 [Candidatus Andersenbacteria bacterium]MBI3250715.1 50S ribosomal protein L32 [Candidatus Andersenbacteria bacterium]
MAVPKRRTSRTRRNNRRSHHGVTAIQLVKDPETGLPTLPHVANPTTGKYKGREVVNVLRKVERDQKRRQAQNQ